MSSPTQPIDLTTHAARIAAAYVSGNRLPVADLPSALRTIHGALTGLGAPQTAPAPAKATEAQIRASIRPDALVSFEDGKPYKALRRHLTLRGLTPADYRRKHGLPIDYPMVTAAYSARRSEISRAIATAQRAPVLQAAEVEAMAAILIAYLASASASTGMAVTTAEYASMTACEAAGEQAKSKLGGWATNVRWSCSPKGDGAPLAPQTR